MVTSHIPTCPKSKKKYNYSDGGLQDVEFKMVSFRTSIRMSTSQNSQLGDSNQNVNLSDANQDSQVNDFIQNVDLCDANQNSQVDDIIQNVDLCDANRNSHPEGSKQIFELHQAREINHLEDSVQSVNLHDASHNSQLEDRSCIVEYNEACKNSQLDTSSRILELHGANENGQFEDISQNVDLCDSSQNNQLEDSNRNVDHDACQSDQLDVHQVDSSWQDVYFNDANQKNQLNGRSQSSHKVDAFGRSNHQDNAIKCCDLNSQSNVLFVPNEMLSSLMSSMTSYAVILKFE
ncbi:hypothetical protein CHS0354_036060 [Potamilus streckersoni]|uniref:Uncharacterized protein n=1 Tax=Potamilus streckersoni TaxID=2493646 RepID=A0AAE0TBD7_9BIVA|nr:hypothetical protein CHS0354_036060 [Potamilus streckersoni]